MKKSFLFIIPLFFLFFFENCKKDDDSPPDNSQKYRVTSVKLFFFGNRFDTLISDQQYIYTNDKLSRLTHQEGVHFAEMDYTYGDSWVEAYVKSYSGSNLDDELKGKYLFQNDLLTNTETLAKVNEQWVDAGHIDFEYSGKNLIKYIRYLSTSPYSKADYEYESDRLTKFTFYNYKDEQWSKWLINEYHYNGNRLSELYSSMALFDPSNFDLKYKMNYVYNATGLLTRVNISLEDSTGWAPAYITQYYYDGNDNLMREEFRYAIDSSLSNYYEYQYEEGKSNIDTLRVFNYDPFNPELVYPTPMNGLPARHLLKQLMRQADVR